jgi:hypothetical protein
MPVPCYAHNASVLNGDQVYVDGAGDDGTHILRFDTASGVWSTLGATSNRRHGNAAFVLGGCLHVAAGGGNPLVSVERYDVATDTWTAVSNMLGGRATFRAITCGSANPAKDQDLFDSLIAKAAREHM